MSTLRIVTGAVVLVLITCLVSGCGDTPTMATQDTDSGLANPDVVNRLPNNIQELQVGIYGGQFDHDIYEVQPGEVQMVVSAGGGPYELSIDNLTEPRKIARNNTTNIGFTIDSPGDYTMRITVGGNGTATLHVLSVGGD